MDRGLGPRRVVRGVRGGDAVKRSATFFFLLAAFLAGAAAGSPLTVLYTNDLHVRLERLESLGHLVAEERETGAPVLLVDAGDTWQDFRSPLSAVWGADAMVAWMNRVGYSAMALGNHELYLGADRLAELGGEARFDVLCANLHPCGDFAPPFLPYSTVSCGDLRVLLVGLVTSELLPYGEFPWLRYEDPAAALAAVLDERRGTADLVVVLCHLPVAEARGLAADVPGVGLFVTGHSHEETREPVRVGDSLIVQAGSFGRTLGRLRLDVDGAARTVRVVDSSLLETEEAPVEVSRGLVRLLQVIFLMGALFLLFLL